MRHVFSDRRTVPPVHTRDEVRSHLRNAHGLEASTGMRLNDLHDTHDAQHQMVSNHQHSED